MRASGQHRNILLRGTVVAALALLLALLLAKPIHLLTLDLGRHIMNGTIILADRAVPQTNTYSYTHAQFPAVNHHWGSGVVFALVHRLAGFTGLSLFSIAIVVLAFLLSLWTAVRRAPFAIATVTGIAAITLVSYRTDVRPEAFSSLFVAAFLWILDGWNRRAHSARWLLLLPLLQVLWVNMHVYFFLGPFLVSAYLAEELERKIRRGGARVAPALWALVAVTITSLLNPAGIRGALVPLLILRNYGYRVAENQSVWFIQSIHASPVLWYMIVLFFVLAAAWTAFLVRDHGAGESPPIAHLILSVAFGTMAILMVRNTALFGLILLPVLAGLLAQLLPSGKLTDAHGALAGIALLVLFGMATPRLWAAHAAMAGIGLVPGAMAPAEFMRSSGLTGPIFNDFDSGGYLIFTLFPRERVYVDNRPEAYPASFLHGTYIRIQEDAEAFRAEDELRRFNVIFFNRQTFTPWGQQFLIRMITEPAWAPVYVDDSAIVFARRNAANAAVIRRYELPQSLFSVRRTR